MIEVKGDVQRRWVRSQTSAPSITKSKIRDLCRQARKGKGVQFFSTLNLDEFCQFAATVDAHIVETMEPLGRTYNTKAFTKKIPSEEPGKVFDRTLLTFINNESKMHQFNEWHSMPQVELEIAGEVIEDILSSCPFVKSSTFYTGHGVSHSGGVHEDYHSLSGDFKKLEALGLCGINLYKYFQPEVIRVILYEMGSCFTGIQDRVDIITQVPKTSEVNRTIGITSTILKACQHVIGSRLRKCFKKYKGDHIKHNLDFLHQYHKKLAQMASITCLYDTYDMSAASDTISRALVERLFNVPGTVRYQYWDLMEGCRSHSYIVRIGKELTNPVPYEKYVAMGNGFCFELESIIFYALTKARFLAEARELKMNENYNSRGFASSLVRAARQVTTFGDDIIVPYYFSKSSWVQYYSCFGFTMNLEKSFSIESQFRESCGGDFENGSFCRGFYLKTRQPTVVDFIRYVNFVKINYQIDDSFLASLAFYQKVVDLYNLNLFRQSKESILCSHYGESIRLTDPRFLFGTTYVSDVPSSFLLVDGPGYSPLLHYKQIDCKKSRWQTSFLTSEVVYLLAETEESQYNPWATPSAHAQVLSMFRTEPFTEQVLQVEGYDPLDL